MQTEKQRMHIHTHRETKPMKLTGFLLLCSVKDVIKIENIVPLSKASFYKRNNKNFNIKI